MNLRFSYLLMIRDVAEEFEREQQEFEAEARAIDEKIEIIEEASADDSSEGKENLESELEQAQQQFTEESPPQGMRLRSNRILPGRTDDISMFQQTKEWKEFKENHAYMFAQAEKKPPPTFDELSLIHI